jgi:hypothetical protein
MADSNAPTRLPAFSRFGVPSLTAAPSASTRQGITLLSPIRVFAAIAVLSFVVNGAPQQLEMLVTGGRVPVYPAVLKVCLLGLFLITLLLRGGRFKSNQRTVVVGLLFFGYLLFDVLFLHVCANYKVNEILLGYNTYFSLALLAIVSLLIPLKIRSRHLVICLCLLAVACAVIGLEQYLKNAPILPTASSDRHFAVQVFSNGTYFNSFSLFEVPKAFALFFVFISALFVAMWRRHRYRPIILVLLPASMAMCWIAHARTELVALGWALIVSAYLTFRKSRSVIRWVPIVAFVSGIVVAFVAYISFSEITGVHSFTNSSSFVARILEWRYYVSMLRDVGAGKLLFGMGFVENASLSAINGPVSIDNIYLSVILDIGVVGLILYLMLAWVLWEEVLGTLKFGATSLHIAVAATISTFFLMGIFSNTPGLIVAYFLLYAISDAVEPASIRD